eukprot:193286-Rhodomonas_salina.1
MAIARHIMATVIAIPTRNINMLLMEPPSRRSTATSELEAIKCSMPESVGRCECSPSARRSSGTSGRLGGGASARRYAPRPQGPAQPSPRNARTPAIQVRVSHPHHHHHHHHHHHQR